MEISDITSNLKYRIYLEDKTVEKDLDNMQIPECCDDCEYFSGDGYNECCQHPEYIDDGFNINSRPGRTVAIGCPLYKRG